MPEQGSRRALPITGAPFTAPFETPVLRLATQGLNLRDPIDAVEIARLTNLLHEGGAGALQVRQGLQPLATGGTVVHSARRLNSPRTASFTRVWGIDTSLYAGASGALTAIDTGYSGDPLTLLPYRPPNSSDTWLYVGDRTRTRKVRATDSLDLPISPATPSLAAASVLQAEQVTPIASFSDDDGTGASAWTGTPGFGFGKTATTQAGPVNLVGASPAIPGVGGGAMAFGCLQGNLGEFTPDGFWYMAGMPKTLDLSLTGIYPASDDDYVHLFLYLSHTKFITEVRIYLVCSASFSATTLPGTGDGTINADFYVKGFSAHDFAQAVQIQQTLVEAAETARVHAVRDRDLDSRRIEDTREAWEVRRAERDPRRSKAPQGPAGDAAWTEFGTLGVPLRRGDFQRIGSSQDRDWATITGIIVYVSTGPGAGGVDVHLDDLYLSGGSGPDSGEPGAQPYDYRYTHYDPRTGDESNPCPEQDETLVLDSLRRALTITPQPAGDAAMRQRFYRRGGSLTADWYFLGENTSDGGSFSDRLTDAGIVAAGTLELDNHPFLTTVDEAGNTVEAAPAPVLFGPVEDLLLALGTPYEPGHVFWSKPGRPGSWPATNKIEVCPPGEPLQNGGLWGGQAFCFSTERMFWLYPNLSGQNQVTASPAQCNRGMLNRWGLVITPIGIVFLNEDGIYVTTGGPPDLLSGELYPLFHGAPANGYRPVDLTVPAALRLEYANQEIWFLYQDDQGTRRAFIYHTTLQYWRAHEYLLDAIGLVYADEGGDDNLVILGNRAGTAYTQGGAGDHGTTVDWRVRTGAINFGRPREDKLFGDLILDLDRQTSEIVVQTFLNEEAVANPVTAISTGVGRQRYIIDPFGLSPQKARTLSLNLAGTSASGRAILYQAGASIIPQPDQTVNRVTQWDDLGHPDEVYLTGLTIDVDTGGVERTFLVEYDIEGVWRTLGPYTVDAPNRHKFKFSWPVVKANLVRIRPIGDCLAWILYRADWIFEPEPPRIVGWDINEENGWDQYVTGVDLDCNTFGATKTVEVRIDGTIVLTSTVVAAGRRVVHLTVQPPVRGHLLRVVATDANPGLLYAHRWHRDEEPSEQTNWNQNFTVAGALPDKYLKGIVLECDTFGQNKSATIEVDGAVVETLIVNTAGRLVKEFSFPQHLGRVFRLLPVDNFPGRLYSHQWIFDQEPLALSRWETQELDHDVHHFHTVLYGHITLKSVGMVTLTLGITINESGKRLEYSYVIPPTDGVKQKRFIPFQAVKGVLFKYTLTADQPFWLYREETQVTVVPWGSSEHRVVQPFGNDDLDRTRVMTAAALAASRSGGGTA